MTRIRSTQEKQMRNLRKAAIWLRQLKTAKKNQVLRKLAAGLTRRRPEILAANQKDEQALSPRVPSAFRDRLRLTEARIQGMIDSVKTVASHPDPVGEEVERRRLRSGLQVRHVRAPIGVLLMIFEARPNIIPEVFALAFKAGNAVAFCAGSESLHTRKVIFEIINQTLAVCGFDESPICCLDDLDNREPVAALLRRPDLVDVAIPRGSDQLIRFVQQGCVPVIKSNGGVNHVYVEADADLRMAVEIVANAKCQRPWVCNAIVTLLVHRSVAKKFLPMVYVATAIHNLAWYGDQKTLEILARSPHVKAAEPHHWGTEYLDYMMNCKVVSGLDEALEHIEVYGTRHSEAIVTRSRAKAQRFQERIDAAVVYWNASTRFTDGGQFGIGGELTMSTEKLHVRGPMGLRDLTNLRWIIEGKGQVRS